MRNIFIIFSERQRRQRINRNYENLRLQIFGANCSYKQKSEILKNAIERIVELQMETDMIKQELEIFQQLVENPVCGPEATSQVHSQMEFLVEM